MKNLPSFLGLAEEGLNTPETKVSILPVPYEATTSYAQGTNDGPEAILEASHQVELYDEELEIEPYRIGIETLPTLSFGQLKDMAAMDHIEHAVDAILKAKKLPIILGGEHSITPPIVRSIAKTYNDVTVVQIDAHADLRQEYHGTPCSHASAMARVREICPAVQIGIRSLSKEEADWAKREKFAMFYAYALKDESWIDQTLAAIKTKNVYLTVDVDGFDSSLMPSTGTPEPGGLFWRETVTFLRKLMQQYHVVGMDFVELMPIEGQHAPNFLVARLISKCIGYWQLGLR
ncbi:MAG: agmatinase [Deltaproteobacteria bacterium]|nr:agmatinase [Deltaproteobacteria bacterium]